MRLAATLWPTANTPGRGANSRRMINHINHINKYIEVLHSTLKSLKGISASHTYLGNTIKDVVYVITLYINVLCSFGIGYE